MNFVRRLREKARAAVDQVFCSSSPNVRLVGDLVSGWFIDTSVPLSAVYCAGVGHGISFELELAKTVPRPILVVDPSPTGIQTIQNSDSSNIDFLAIGMAAESQTFEFSVPRNDEGSYSVPQDGLPTVSFECWDLARIMNRSGDRSIDLLKMDIEGFEYDIVDSFLAEGLPVRQLCVEFHSWLRKGRTPRSIARLYGAGYRIIHKRRGDYTFLLDEARFRKLESDFNRRVPVSSSS